MRSLKRAVLGKPPVPEVVEGLVGNERFYRMPPLTDEIVAAMHRIAPNCSDYRATEKYRDLWEQYQNAACWGEYLALKPRLESLPRPRRVLEIGPGLGRSLVFFTKKLAWHDVDLHAYEGDGTTTKYTKLGPRFQDSFCGDIRVLRAILDYNSTRNVTIHDAGKTPLADLPGPFDLIYSFYSVGFHWSLEHFLDDLLSLLRDGGTGIFTIPPGFEPSPKLAGVRWEIVPLYPNARKANRRDSLLLMTNSLPPRR